MEEVNTTNPQVEEQTTQNVQEESAVKTFTQDEFNEALKKEVARKTKNIPSSEELKAFNEWKEAQKTQEEKIQEVLKENETLKAQMRNEHNSLVVANAGVDEKFTKFVISEVSQLDGVFEDNLKTYLEENKQYLKQTKSEPVSTGFSQSNIQKVDQEKAYLDKKYANNPYYKK